MRDKFEKFGLIGRAAARMQQGRGPQRTLLLQSAPARWLRMHRGLGLLLRVSFVSWERAARPTPQARGSLGNLSAVGGGPLPPGQWRRRQEKNLRQ